MSPSLPGVRWYVVVATDRSATTIPLDEGAPAWVGSGREAAIRIEPSEPAHLQLTPAGDVLELDAHEPVLLNDVQVRGKTQARPGDVLEVGPVTLLVQRGQPLPVSRPPYGYDAFVAVLGERLADPSVDQGRLAIARAKGTPVEALAEDARSLVPSDAKLGAFANDALAVWAPVSNTNGTPPTAEAPVTRTRRVVVGVARFPQHGRTPHALLAAALARMGEDELPPLAEPLIADPTMVALRAVLERYLRAGRSVTLFGEAGAGKRTWAISALRRARLQSVRIDPRPELEVLAERVQGAAGAWLYLDRPDLLPLPLQQYLTRTLAATGAPSFVAALPDDPQTLGREGALEPDLAELLSRIVLRLPALRERPGDLDPLVEAILDRARRLWRRPEVTLGAAAREALQRHPFPGNVPELEVALMRAALIAPSDELRPSDLPEEIAARAAADSHNVRGALKTVERDAYLDALNRTRWNVSEAARTLGLPRRTLVYRMRKLGLRRPRREA